MRDSRALGIAKLLIAVATASALAGCFHVPVRARENGRELGYQAESMVIYGQHNPRATRQMSSMLQSGLNVRPVITISKAVDASGVR